jgi:hypothetical protein
MEEARMSGKSNMRQQTYFTISLSLVAGKTLIHHYEPGSKHQRMGYKHLIPSVIKKFKSQPTVEKLFPYCSEIYSDQSYHPEKVLIMSKTPDTLRHKEVQISTNSGKVISILFRDLQ